MAHAAPTTCFLAYPPASPLGPPPPAPCVPPCPSLAAGLPVGLQGGAAVRRAHPQRQVQDPGRAGGACWGACCQRLCARRGVEGGGGCVWCICICLLLWPVGTAGPWCCRDGPGGGGCLGVCAQARHTAQGTTASSSCLACTSRNCYRIALGSCAGALRPPVASHVSARAREPHTLAVWLMHISCAWASECPP